MSSNNESQKKKRSPNPSVAASAKKKKAPSKQAVNAEVAKENKKGRFIATLAYALRSIVQKPSAYSDPEFKCLREFCQYRDQHRNLFPTELADGSILEPGNGGEPVTELTRGYIECLAGDGDTSYVTNPILQVVSNETTFHKPPFGKTVFGKPQQSVKITHLRLLDGDGNTLLGRFAIDLVSEGKKLVPGDIIRLELFTELHHAINEKDAPPKPVVFISKFTLVGNYFLPPKEEIMDPLESTVRVEVDDSSNKPKLKPNHLGQFKVPECTGNLCSVHGVRMVVCVCKANPINKINLQTVKDECWFADEEVANMTQSHKRCMLYWWFATNIYGISGSHKRAPLPDCLVAAVRNEYPEPNGIYTDFKPWE